MVIRSVIPILILCLFPITLRAEELWRLDSPVADTPRANDHVERVNKKSSGEKGILSQEPVNLSVDFLKRNFARLEQTSSAVVLPSQSLVSILKGLYVGQRLKASVFHSIMSFPDEKAPVLAVIQEGPFEGYKLIGKSSLEKNSKRIFLEFETIAINQKTYHLKATAMSQDGQNGFIGEYHSHEGKNFFGNFLSSFVAGYFDGLIPRQTNVFGQIQTDSSIDSAAKKGLASGAMASAERFRDKLKSASEFSELKGPIELEVVVLEKATAF